MPAGSATSRREGDVGRALRTHHLLHTGTCAAAAVPRIDDEFSDLGKGRVIDAVVVCGDQDGIIAGKVRQFPLDPLFSSKGGVLSRGRDFRHVRIVEIDRTATSL